VDPNSGDFETKHHSPWGLTSFGLWCVITSIDYRILYMILNRRDSTDGLLGVLIFYFPMLIAPLFNITGLVLGIIGLVKAKQTESKRLFCILGIFFNTVVAAFVWACGVFLITPTGVH
jgi:hypothetical protein